MIHTNIAKRFRGFLPVVIDVETGGFDAETDALLEIAAVILTMDKQGRLQQKECHSYHVLPFEGANLCPDALAFNKIDPYHPFRFAVAEQEALTDLFKQVRQSLKDNNCKRAVLVGHNAWFDLSFIKAAAVRCKIQNNPFHAFTSFDTATLGALAYGQTVLARTADAAGIEFNRNEAHSAVYDAERTAELFCTIVNKWQEMEELSLRQN